MKRLLSLLLALTIVISTSAPVIASESTVGTNVTLKALNVVEGMTSISDSSHVMNHAETKEVGTITLTESGTLPDNLNDLAPAMTGWTFQGWYTAPVKYAFWGDNTTSGYASEPFPEGFEKDCNGNPYEWQEKDPNALHSLNYYWIWLSTLEGEGQKVNPGDAMPEGKTELYACYAPTTINYKQDFSGWGGRTGVLSCSRQYGTPFGSDDVDKNGWSGFVFDGWYTASGEGPIQFYDLPQNGERYVAHWHSKDNRVNWSNYQAQGYTPVTSVVLDVETLQLHANSGISRTIHATVNPADSGVTQLTWKSSDDSIVTVEVQSGGTSAVVRPAGKEGTAKITVSSANGCSDTVLIDTGSHVWGNSTVIKWGNCASPTVIRYTCAYCGKTEVRETYSQHRYAYREIPATCTTPCIWEHYCQVCGQVDTAGNMTRTPALGHKFLTTTLSGCGGTITTKTCTVCGLTEATYDNIAVHDWSPVATVDVRPTCNSNGSQSIKCLNCGAVKEGSSTEIPADPSLHVWEPWVVQTEATETTEGLKTRTCSVCHTEESRAIPPTSYVVDTSGIGGNVTSSGSEQVADQTQANTAIQNTINNLLNSGSASMLADDILYAAMLQKEIATEVRVTPVAKPENASDASKFNALLGNNANVLYMDIDIFVTADGENIGRITETDDAMTFNVAFPTGGRIVNVLRAHEGDVEAIPYWVDGNMIYFTTDRFSTFAVSVSNDISLATVDAIADQAHTGSEIQPSVTVTINGNETLVENKDYTLSYKNNTEVGTATVTITGIGDFVGSSQEVNFQIVESSTSSQETSTTSSPNTGDEFHLALWVMMCLFSGIGMVTLATTKRRKYNQ